MADKKDIKKQEDELLKQQKEHQQRTRVGILLRIYQDAGTIAKDTYSTLGVDIKSKVITELSRMITIVEKDDWVSVHPHDAFPKIDIRMLAYGCPAHIECPILLAILRKIGMQRSDYVNYRRRMGMMVAMEHKRKRGKMR